jgi:CheY-like chemotaxis protein
MTPQPLTTTAPERRPVILVVDDEPANLQTFARAFRKEFVVRVAASPALALEALDGATVDVVIADYTMPGMTGIELLRSVASRWPAIARVIVSGHAELPELHDAHRTGLAAELLPKPWRRADIIRVVNQLVPARGTP